MQPISSYVPSAARVKLLVFDKQGMPRPYHSDIVDVAYGRSSGWKLRIEVNEGGHTFSIIFPQPVSFRVQDEREMVDYWLARDLEKVPAGLLYSIAQSRYLDEFAQSPSVTHQPLIHLLITGYDTCVEVLTQTPSILPAGLA